MSSELLATDYAENCWELAVSASLRSVPTTECESLTQVSPIGKCFVLTNEPLPVQLAHLIPKCTKVKQTLTGSACIIYTNYLITVLLPGPPPRHRPSSPASRPSCATRKQDDFNLASKVRGWINGLIGPKLTKYLRTGPLPSAADSSHVDIKFIYHTLSNPFGESESSTTLDGSNSAASIVILAQVGNPIDQNLNSSLDLAEPDKHNSISGILGGSDLSGPWDPELRFKRVAKWIDKVECACGQNVKVGPGNHSSPDLKQYAAASLQSQLSSYDGLVPWSVPLPDLKERGVLSSNDQVEIANLPPLTRKLGSD
ncbi:unnamed protein product [Rhizoctonia solani]|uniref:Uncharacterized protein n=1 Tax=Rhizoctonia solani TaxID=456999 RepID=A0A8H2XGE8_9AGAM|nr:unnamed protein product [Rhizoctonia solani]